jgi:hypothetical protein
VIPLINPPLVYYKRKKIQRPFGRRCIYAKIRIPFSKGILTDIIEALAKMVSKGLKRDITSQ